jgi:hypothetical protein
MDISTNMVLKDTYTKVPITSGLVWRNSFHTFQA